MKNICRVFVFLSMFFAAHIACSATLPGIPEFIDEMVSQHQFQREQLENVFARTQHLPMVIAAMSRPSSIRPWLEYRAALVDRKRIRLGLAFWNKHHHTLRLAEARYGAPQEIIVAIIGVETLYGHRIGNFRVMDTLTTLAFDYPRRADFYRDELRHYLLLAREQQFNLLSIRGSFAGALGIPQFMPSSYRNYAVDFNGNHRIDLLHEERDAIGSVANYLHSYGWVRNDPVAVRAQSNDETISGESRTTRSLAEWEAAGVTPEIGFAPDKPARLLDFTVADGKEFWLAFNNFEVITRYNKSSFYAMSVFQLAEKLKVERDKAAAK